MYELILFEKLEKTFIYPDYRLKDVRILIWFLTHFDRIKYNVGITLILHEKLQKCH